RRDRCVNGGARYRQRHSRCRRCAHSRFTDHSGKSSARTGRDESRARGLRQGYFEFKQFRTLDFSDLQKFGAGYLWKRRVAASAASLTPGRGQKLLASIPKAGLNLLRKFSSAITAANSTNSSSLKCFFRRLKNLSVTRFPV